MKTSDKTIYKLAGIFFFLISILPLIAITKTQRLDYIIVLSLLSVLGILNGLVYFFKYEIKKSFKRGK